MNKISSIKLLDAPKIEPQSNVHLSEPALTPGPAPALGLFQTPGPPQTPGLFLSREPILNANKPNPIPGFSFKWLLPSKGTELPKEPVADLVALLNITGRVGTITP